MIRILKAPLVLTLLLLPLAACNDDDDDSSSRDPQDEFGSTFAAAFDADANDDPIDPEPGDAGELSLTDDPIDF